MSKPDTAPPASTPRLARFRVDHPVVGVPPHFHNLGLVDCQNPDGRIVGWSILIRGAAVFFVSPRGAEPPSIVEIPRQHVTFVWAGDATGVEKLQRVDVPPLARAMPVQPVEPAIPSKELGDP